jgi:hypothetical protein
MNDANRPSQETGGWNRTFATAPAPAIEKEKEKADKSKADENNPGYGNR